MLTAHCACPSQRDGLSRPVRTRNLGLLVIATAVSVLGTVALAVPPARTQAEWTRQESARELRRQMFRVVSRGRLRSPNAPTGKVDFVHLDQDLTLDTDSKVVSTTIVIKAKGVGTALEHMVFMMDEGLTVSTAAAPGHTVVVDQTPYGPVNIVTVGWSPAAAVGTEVAVTAQLAGTVRCGTWGPGYGPLCQLGRGEFGFLHEGSAFPWLFDDQAAEATDDYLTRSLTLRSPSGTRVAVSADLVDQHDDGATLVTKWELPFPGTRTVDFFLITGSLRVTPVDTALPTVVLADSSAPKWSTEMAAWAPHILEYMKGNAGRSLPYKQLTLINVPASLEFVGTASYAMTLLAGETYSQMGPEGFEEIWAHENIHLWWGINVWPLDTSLTSLLTEGLTTLCQYDYTHQRHHTQEDRDSYLGRRMRDNDLMLRYLTDPKTLPPVVLSDPKDRPEDPRRPWVSTVWAYYKTSALLDQLRLFVGEGAFATGLHNWATACSFKACDTDRFRQVMEAASGKELGGFFDQYVYASAHPGVEVSFVQEPKAGGGVRGSITLRQDGDRSVPLELFLVAEDGSIRRQPVLLQGASDAFPFEASARLRAVRPNPRHNPVFWTRSAVDGDLDFDGEVDGLDVLHCSLLHGREVKFNSTPGESVYGLDLSFDPRCDGNADGRINDADMDPLIALFPKVK